MDEPGRRPSNRRSGANWILAGLITAGGAIAFVLTVRTGRADSAMLFVGLPVLLAAALALTPPRTTHGRVFVVTTIVLLLTSVALHEGAICVVLAAPLVYAVVHGSTALVCWLHESSSRTYAVLVLPLLLLGGVEGSVDGLRIAPDQSVEVVRVVPVPAGELAGRLAAGPRPTPVRSIPLRMLGVPLPQHVHGTGLDVGDRWAFGYHGTSHGPGGHLLAEVDSVAPDRIGFRLVEDTSITARWLSWQRADIHWRTVDAGHTEVRVTVAYRRGLDPSWYFGPLQDGLVHEGASHLLDMLDLR
ncbi:hypothetical protein ABNF97_14315 [Plantactinospora sp. B6F1]|uniref:hypothetical protein n=1 Tax=Plantactinospora sp. B6F1 TaxID=3158971 RepID=UPI0032D98006